MDRLVRIVLACTAFLVVVIGLLDWRKQRKLNRMHDDMKGGHASLHQRFDRGDQEISYLHAKVDKVRRGIATIFKGSVEEFLDWWRS